MLQRSWKVMEGHGRSWKVMEGHGAHLREDSRRVLLTRWRHTARPACLPTTGGPRWQRGCLGAAARGSGRFVGGGGGAPLAESDLARPAWTAD